MKCAVIAIGDEIVSGAVVDTNTAWISDKLLDLGLPVCMHLAVADEMDDILESFALAGEKAGAVIVTGGLGPTADDLTREAFARYAGAGMVQNRDALEKLESIFKLIGREMTPNNIKQADIPEGSTIIPNPTGTAPGFLMEHKGATYYFLPGVPSECRRMMEETVLPRIASGGDGGAIKVRLLKTFGMTESMLDQRLSPLELPQGVKLGYRAVFPEIHLKLAAAAPDAKSADELLARAGALVRAEISEVIFSDDGRSLEEVVLDACRGRGMKIALAESCTGGLIAKRLTDIAGSSDVFERGFVTYSNRAKTELLGVPAELIAEHGAVSEEVARAMAEGALGRSGADLAAGVTGVAGPGGGTKDKPVGTVHVGLAGREGVWHREFRFTRWNREMVRELTAQAVLEILRRKVLGLAEWSG